MNQKEYQWHDLDGTHGIWIGDLPQKLASAPMQLEELWGPHPIDDIHMLDQVEPRE